MPPYGSIALSRQSLSSAQVMSSPWAVFPAHTFGQYFPSHASWHARHALRDRSDLPSKPGRHAAASRATYAMRDIGDRMFSETTNTAEPTITVADLGNYEIRNLCTMFVA